ncbi:flagellar protein FliT [Pseudomonas sp. GD03860]|uniref:flagellar protein FliT n=1 Tax=Pseudomonas TaxID=286 RepID=UPI0023647FE9|nr:MULTISPECIES: flagellar protein FliT [Pseudomonas]MDD2060781.1 flagellar protein FliT [Pseudomonas putida]MDH0638263.1 flagellar protein FliT [Pseudomonas sp. GD03860]
MNALQHIDATRQALSAAMQDRDWVAIGELDTACRNHLEDALRGDVDDPALRESLEALLGVYRQLIDVTSDARQFLVDEMAQLRQAKSAAKVYHLFT